MLLQFLAPFIQIPFDERDAVLYGTIRAELKRAGTPIGANDLFIAAQTAARNLILVTNNVSEFQRIPGLRLENWV